MVEEAKVAAPKEAAKKDVVIPEKFKKLVDEIEKMNVLDLSELVKVLEDKFGVSAAAPMAMAAAPAGAEVEEKTEFDLELAAAGTQKIQVIKVIRELTGKGLKEAKDICDAAPKMVKEKMPKKDAEEAKKKIEAAGGKANLK